MTILHIDSSAQQQGSISRQLSARIVSQLGDEVIRRDLSDALPPVNEIWVASNFTPAEQRTPEQQEALALSDMLVAELQRADTIVIGSPVYNFSIPSVLKAWIDQVVRAGLTFNYTEKGPVGLLDGKRAIVAMASAGMPIGSEIDFASGYLRHILGFVGITDVQIIAADQLRANRDKAIEDAHQKIAELGDRAKVGAVSRST